MPLLELRNLRVLSLRQNRLRSIPPAIRELVNLESLNVAGNQLEDLPFEILELMMSHKLRDLTCHPNPWCVDEHASMGSTGQETTVHSKYTGLKFVRRSSRVCKPMLLERAPNPESKIPSLREIVLRQLAKLDPQTRVDFRALMPPETPDIVLDQLDVLHKAPGRRCNYCQRPMVLAAKERIEWWSARWLNGTKWDWSPLPFRRLECREGCSEINDSWREQGKQVTIVSK